VTTPRAYLAWTRHPRVVPVLDVVLVVAVDVLVHAWLRRLGLGVAVTASGILVSLGLATWLLRRRGLHWRALGLCRPERPAAAIVTGLGLFGFDVLLLPVIASRLATTFELPPQDLGAFAGLAGNTVQYLLLLIPIAWGTAAFGEEMLYRGYFLRRLEDALGRSGWATAAALLIQTAVFAFGHAYLGPRGMLNAALIGLAAGVTYVSTGRNLWPLIVAHGLVDTASLTALYLGAANLG
jgi:membrane protease YdiL (CAAX protease family)